MRTQIHASIWHEQRWSLRSLMARHGAVPALRDVGALGIGALLSQAIFLLSAPLFLRLYEPADFGRYSFVYSTIALIATVITWKMERLIVVVPARATAVRLLVAVLSTAIIGGVLLLVLVLVSWPFARPLQSELQLVWLAPLSVLILAATAGIRSYIIRTGDFKSVAVAQVARAVVFAVGILGTASVGGGASRRGAIIMLSWQVLADATALVVQLRASQQTARLIIRRPRLRESYVVLLRLRKTIGALAVSEVLRSINQQLPIATVALGFGATPAGWYSLAAAFVSVPASIIALAVGDVANQRLSRLHAAGKPIAHLVLRTTIAMAAAGLLPFAAIGLFAPGLLPVVMGAKWSGASDTVAIIAVASYLWFVTEPATNVPLIVGARRYIMLWHALRMVNWVGFGAAAACGLLTYNGWIVLTVAGRSLVYGLELVLGFVLARTADNGKSAPEIEERLAVPRLEDA